jgi:hypothetical protein
VAETLPRIVWMWRFAIADKVRMFCVGIGGLRRR